MVLLSNMCKCFTAESFIIHYDIQTFNNLKICEPYVVGYTTQKGGEVIADYSTFEGVGCMRRFVNFVLKFAADYDRRRRRSAVYLNAFNGANFEHYEFMEIAFN